MLKAVVDFELTTNKSPEWTFRNGGLTQLNDDFLLLGEYLAREQNVQLNQLCDRWGNFFLNDQDQQELQDAPDETRGEMKLEKLKPLFQPLWFFFVAICHALQEGENELMALDAFWLGLIDEVIGQPALPTLRLLSEFRPSPSTGS